MTIKYCLIGGKVPTMPVVLVAANQANKDQFFIEKYKAKILKQFYLKSV